MSKTAGWVTTTLWRDEGIGVIPVEADCAMCPYCGKRWAVSNIDPADLAHGRTRIICEKPGGCGKAFNMEATNARR